MALVIRNPDRGIWNLFSFPALKLTNYGGESRRGGSRAWAPKIDKVRSRAGLKFRLDLPGAVPDDVDVTATGDVLTIRGRKHEERKVEKKGYAWREYSQVSFCRSITLPEKAETGRAYGTMDGEVLEITVPYRKPAQPARIEVTSTGDKVTEANTDTHAPATTVTTSG